MFFPTPTVHPLTPLIQCHAGNFTEDTKLLIKTWAKSALKENFLDMLMEHKDSIKENSSSTLDKTFLDVSKSDSSAETKGLEQLVDFFKAQVDHLEQELSSKLDQKPNVEDCLKVRLLEALFAKDDNVSSWVADDLRLIKILVPESEAKVVSALEDLDNIKQMSSVLSLQSLKVLLKPIFDEKFQQYLDLVVEKVTRTQKYR